MHAMMAFGATLDPQTEATRRVTENRTPEVRNAIVKMTEKGRRYLSRPMVPIPSDTTHRANQGIRRPPQLR